MHHARPAANSPQQFEELIMYAVEKITRVAVAAQVVQIMANECEGMKLTDAVEAIQVAITAAMSEPEGSGTIHQRAEAIFYTDWVQGFLKPWR